ncbi:MAG: PIN domain-containing protein [Gammaproteobacteria bacterium]|nr:PIN domain-containing protein [Gammaproteobacteria bacterium]
MILVDAGPLIALFDRRDAAHRRCVETLKPIDEPMATTPPVLTEAFHLLNPSSAGALNLMDFISEGGLDVLFLNEDVLMRCFELMAQYADAPMDFADASLVAMAESHNSRKVFSIDRGDFATYRIKRGHHYITFDVLG